MRNKGIGDTIEAITKATGIKKVVDWFSDKTGLDCGCDKRKELLNKLFPYKNQAVSNCLTKEQYEAWGKFRDMPGETVTHEEAKLIAKIHAHVFGHKNVMPCKCEPKKWQQWVRDINRVYEAYEAPQPTKTPKPKPKTTTKRKPSTGAKTKPRHIKAPTKKPQTAKAVQKKTTPSKKVEKKPTARKDAIKKDEAPSTNPK